MGWTAGVLFQAGTRDFYPPHRVKTGYVEHPSFYPVDTRGSFPEGKVARPWTWPPRSPDLSWSSLCGALLNNSLILWWSLKNNSKYLKRNSLSKCYVFSPWKFAALFLVGLMVISWSSVDSVFHFVKHLLRYNNISANTVKLWCTSTDTVSISRYIASNDWMTTE